MLKRYNVSERCTIRYVLNLFLTEGWDAVTYDRIAKEMGITKSSLQHYANKMQFAYALEEGEVFQQLSCWTLLTGVSCLLDSWKRSLNENQIFRECLHIMTNALAPISATATTKAVTRPN
ncbi:TetR family transcriptional regulator [Vibrio lentus]|nr:TetR family transcriptional regulator [Vibrio lentus]